MKCIAVDIDVQPADAERVSLRFNDGELLLTYLDIYEKPRTMVFRDVLAFRWQEFDEEDIRDDMPYEVVDSAWLARQGALQGEHVSNHAHYKLCFNADGCTLDVLCLREVAGS